MSILRTINILIQIMKITLELPDPVVMHIKTQCLMYSIKFCQLEEWLAKF